ncbi:hypothetical protein O1M63_22915 [Streptomyces mirabilis]|nr:hypothetical protein [Streptomyces mirabilis]
MTQSGQGEQPSARTAREGIVLPSDGGEPLLPGMTGDRAVPAAPAIPAGGQTWDQPWGPDPSAAPARSPPRAGERRERHPDVERLRAVPVRRPTPDWGGHDPSTQTWAAPEQPAQGWGPAPPSSRASRPSRPRRPAPGRGHPAAVVRGAATVREQPPSYGGQETSSYGGPQDPAYGGHQGGAVPRSSRRARTPPRCRPPCPGRCRPPSTRAPRSTSRRFRPRPRRDAVPAARPDHARRGRDAAHPAGGPGCAAARGAFGAVAPAAHPDAEATQYIAPVPAEPGAAPYGIRPGGPEDRQPPAEFDNLFRSAPGAQGASEGPRPRSNCRGSRPLPARPHTPHAPYAAQAPGCPERRAGGPPPGAARPTTTAVVAAVDGAARASR